MKNIVVALGLMMFTVAFTACNQKELDAQKATIEIITNDPANPIQVVDLKAQVL